MRYLPLSDADRAIMLKTIGAASVDDLFADVPEEARLDGPIHGLPMHASEMAVERQLGAMARKNMVAGEVPFFLGCGAYKHHVPASVDHLIQRGEFLTAYTPYQPEIAQGTLQVLFEFQSQVARLYGCEVANASMYDGSTDAGNDGMARRITRKKKAIIRRAPPLMSRVAGRGQVTETPPSVAYDPAAATPSADRQHRRRDQRVVVQYTESRAQQRLARSPSRARKARADRGGPSRWRSG